MYFLFITEVENGRQKFVSMANGKREKQRKKTCGEIHTRVQCSAGT